MEDKRQEELAIFDVCTPLIECEGIIPSIRSNANEANDRIISTMKKSEMMLQNGLINLTQKEIVTVDKGADEAQTPLKPVPEQKPNPSSAEAHTENKAGTDQIGNAPEPAPVPVEPNQPLERKRGRRGRPRSTRTIDIDPSPETGIQDNGKQRRGRPTITDDNDGLPPDWEVRTETRRNGATAGRKDKYYISPDGRRFRSRAGAVHHIYGPTRVVADYHLRTRAST